MILQHPATIDFDPSNKEHRQAVKAFLKRKAWSDTKLRFTHDPVYGSVASQVQGKLLDWYLEQEDNRSKKIQVVKN